MADHSYDGFISYSHAADGLLAPRLQAGLQRFAKPWWKRRALRLFRDESSLSANPHLWSSITEALDQSGWFVLLLSPAAAGSEWVGQEIEYWTANRDPSRILPVVTDGEFGWADGDVVGDAVPAVLRGVFSEEPRWVDLRWAKDEDQLDLQDPRFADAIADIGSALRGVPKDELASEEVRQHRRTVRTAWAAGGLVTVLAVAAVGFGIQSSRNADEAERQAAIAEGQGAIAQANAEEAAANAAAAESSARAEAEARQTAEDNALEAVRNSSIAHSSSLAAAATNEFDGDLELATLLALEAINVAESASVPASVDALPTLRRASQANRLIDRIDFGGGLIAADFVPDGSAVIVMSDVDRSVSRYPVRNLSEPSWVYRDLTTHDLFREVAVSPDAQTVALIVTDDRSEAEAGPEVVLDEQGTDGLPARVMLLDAATGRSTGTIPLDPCIEPSPRLATDSNRSGWSPDGSVFALLIEETTCAEAGTLLLDPVDWSELVRFNRAGEVSFTGDGAQLLVLYPFEGADLLAFPSLELVRSFDFDIRPVPPRHAAISRDGSTIYFHNEPIDDTRPGFWDVEEDRFLGWASEWEGLAQGVRFGDDGRALVMGADSDGLYDPRTGLPFMRFHTSGTTSASFSSAAELVATGSRGGLFELWSVGSGEGTPVEPEDSTLAWVNPNWIVGEDPVGVFAFTVPDELPYDLPPDSEPFESGVFVLDPETGAVQASRQFIIEARALEDGRFVSFGLVAPNEDFETLGPLAIWDPVNDTLEVVQDCVASRADYFPAGYVCPDGSLLPDDLVVSHDLTRFATMASDPEAAPPDAVDLGDITSKLIVIWDPETGEAEREVRVEGIRNPSLTTFGPGWIILEEEPNAYRVIDLESGDIITDLSGAWRFSTADLSADGSRFYAAQTSGELTEFDTETWEPVRTWQAQEGRPRGIALSPDGARLAVSGEDGLIVIWDIDGQVPVVVDRIPAAANRISDIVWMDDNKMGAVLVRDFFQIEWQVIDLDQNRVARRAATTLVRSFTTQECQLYGIDPCPTLDQIWGR